MPGQQLSWLFDGAKILIYGQSSFISNASLPRGKKGLSWGSTPQRAHQGVCHERIYLCMLLLHIVLTFVSPPSNVFFVSEYVSFFNNVKGCHDALLPAAAFCVVSRSLRRFAVVNTAAIDGNPQAVPPSNNENCGHLDNM